MNTTIVIVQLSSALIMMLSILLQQRGSGLGLSFGGTGNVYRTKRGIEYILMYVTIITAFFFAFSSLLAVIF